MKKRRRDMFHSVAHIVALVIGLLERFRVLFSQRLV